MKTREDYSRMQKEYYENPDLDPKVQVVGNYAWHEAFPYEDCLLNFGAEPDTPIMTNLNDKVALDFGCGPGRMIKRMSKLFKRVDGADISQRLIDIVKQENPKSNFYVTDGTNLGNAPDNTYDFVYSTIAMQHIASCTIRQRIFQDMFRVLKPSGCVTIQMAYNATYSSRQHAKWSEDRYDAPGTNSVCDVIINQSDLENIPDSFSILGYKDITWWLYRVDDKYDNLNGQTHPSDYWPTHWIFLNAWKND